MPPLARPEARGLPQGCAHPRSAGCAHPEETINTGLERGGRWGEPKRAGNRTRVPARLRPSHHTTTRPCACQGLATLWDRGFVVALLRGLRRGAAVASSTVENFFPWVRVHASEGHGPRIG